MSQLLTLVSPISWSLEESSVIFQEAVQAIQQHFEEGGVVTYDLGGDASTSEVGQAIADRCKAMLEQEFQ